MQGQECRHIMHKEEKRSTCYKCTNVLLPLNNGETYSILYSFEIENLSVLYTRDPSL